MTTAHWIMMIIGTVPGFYAGRWRAETQRARFDQDTAWNSRHKYRDGE